MEKLLIFHMNDMELKKIKQIAGAQKIRYELVEPASYMQTLGALATGTPSPLTEPFCGTVPEESMLLMCDFTEKRIDKLLLALRRAKVQMDYKAVLTPTNRKWNVMRLMLEMRAEKNAYEKMNHSR